jgi:hypothetical protein
VRRRKSLSSGVASLLFLKHLLAGARRRVDR